MTAVQTSRYPWVVPVVVVNEDVGIKKKLIEKPTILSYLFSAFCVLLFSLYRFNTFHLEASSSCRYDYVAVYDGQDSLAPLLGKFCGVVLPPSLQSSTNQLFIIFRTDASVNGIGWRATYSETLGRCYSIYVTVEDYPFQSVKQMYLMHAMHHVVNKEKRQ